MIVIAVKPTAMWKEENNQLIRKFRFGDFSEAVAFLVRVALIAEKMNHHPDIRNTYNEVEIRLSTHDAGSVVTQKDWKFAAEVDMLLPVEHHDY